MDRNNQTSQNIDRAALIQSLTQRLTGSKCPMCGHQQFTVVEGYTVNPIQYDIKNFNIGGKALPTINLICNNCGFVSSHAIGVFQTIVDEKTGQQNNK